jgi:hypothetical protein
MNRQRDDTWTGQFVKNGLKKHNSVESVELLGPKLIRIHRKTHDSVVVATTAVERLDAAAFRAAINGAALHPDYVVNIPAESIVLGDAIQLAREHGVGVGQFKDLMGALGSSDVSGHLSSDLRYVEENLPQHERVTSIEPLADRHYRIERDGLPPVQVVFIHEYDLTVDHVRMAKQRYRSFSAIVITNPNGHATGEAERLAATMNCRIYVWKTFYGALNKRVV